MANRAGKGVKSLFTIKLLYNVNDYASFWCMFAVQAYPAEELKSKENLAMASFANIPFLAGNEKSSIFSANT